MFRINGRQRAVVIALAIFSLQLQSAASGCRCRNRHRMDPDCKQHPADQQPHRACSPTGTAGPDVLPTWCETLPPCRPRSSARSTGTSASWPVSYRRAGLSHTAWATLTANSGSASPATQRITTTWFEEYKKWTDTGLDTMLGTLKAAGLQGEQLQSEQGILGSLRRMASSTNGRLAALQVVGDIAEQQTQQMMKLRQIMLADLQSKQAYQAVQMQKEAATQAGVEQFFKYDGRTPDGQTFQGGWK